MSNSLLFSSYTIPQQIVISNPPNTAFDLISGSTQIVTYTGVLGNAIVLSGKNYAAGRECKILINVTGNVTAITYPSAWAWINSKPSGLSQNQKAVLTITCTGSADNNVWTSFGMGV
jgi:hypothetical protein